MFNNPLSGHIDTFYLHKNDKYGTAIVLFKFQKR